MHASRLSKKAYQRCAFDETFAKVLLSIFSDVGILVHNVGTGC